jgi:hypothetical protein
MKEEGDSEGSRIKRMKGRNETSRTSTVHLHR